MNDATQALKDADFMSIESRVQAKDEEVLSKLQDASRDEIGPKLGELGRRLPTSRCLNTRSHTPRPLPRGSTRSSQSRAVKVSEAE